MVPQNPTRLRLSLRVQENQEFSISSGCRRPASRSLSTESGMNAYSPTSVLRRFLLLRMKTGRRVRMKSSDDTKSMNDSGSFHWRFFPRRTIISPKSARTSSGAPLR